MTNLKKLGMSLNLKVLDSTETNLIKGGRVGKIKLNISTSAPTKPSTPTRPNTGSGLPPPIDS